MTYVFILRRSATSPSSGDSRKIIMRDCQWVGRNKTLYERDENIFRQIYRLVFAHRAGQIVRVANKRKEH